MNDSIIIARNTRLTSKIVARQIHVSTGGELTIIASQYGPDATLPELTIEYLEALCSKFYYGGYYHKNAIADIMLLNGYLRLCQYDDFYSDLQRNLKEQRVTIIYSELFL